MPPAPSKRPNIGNSGKRAKSAQSNPAQRFSQRNGGENLEESEGDLEAEDDDGASIQRKANDLIRLAICTEYRRGSLKRDEITKKIFGGRTSKDNFDRVLKAAQEGLKNSFGMELHELMSRAEKHRVEATREGANENGEMQITGAKKKVAGSSSRQYMLRSVLDPELIEATALVDVEIEEAERKEREELYPNNEDRRTHGTLITCDSEDDGYQLSLTGILHVLLALILVNGRVLSDMQLRTYLKRLQLPLEAHPPTTVSGPAGYKTTIDAYLAQLIKQSYLEKQKANATGSQGGQKRMRGGAAVGGDNNEYNLEWKWGSRAIAEIGEEGIGGFIVDFMHHIETMRRSSEDGDEAVDGGSAVHMEQAEKTRDKLLKAVGRAAGGGLESYQ